MLDPRLLPWSRIGVLLPLLDCLPPQLCRPAGVGCQGLGRRSQPSEHPPHGLSAAGKASVMRLAVPSLSNGTISNELHKKLLALTRLKGPSHGL